MIYFLFLIIFSLLYYRMKSRVPKKKLILLNIIRVFTILILIWLIFNPVWTRENTKIIPRKNYFLVDCSKSMQIRDESPDGSSRIDAVNNVIGQYNHPCEIIGLGSDLYRNLKTPLLSDDFKSDLYAGLNTFFEELNDNNPAEIFLLSDGRISDSDLKMGFPYPLSTVGYGNPNEQIDLAIDRVDAPSFAEVETKIDFTVKFSANKIPPDTKITIISSDETNSIIGKQMVSLKDKTEVVFSVIPKKTGLRNFKFSVTAEGINEPYQANNRKNIGVMVQKNVLKIMVIGKPCWDMAFLLRKLKNIKNSSVSTYNLLGRRSEEFFSLDTNTVHNQKDVIEVLKDKDVLILYSINPDIFDPQLSSEIRSFVKEKGSSVLFAGRMGDVGLSNNYLIKQMFPLKMVEEGVKQRPVKISCPLVKTSHPLLAELFRTIDFSMLPPLNTISSIYEPKPGIETFLEIETQTGRKYPLFAVSNFGVGKSAVLTGTGFYKWNLETQNTSVDLLDAFVHNTIGWLASKAEDAFMHINIPSINFPLGENIPIEVIVLDRTYSHAQNAKLTAMAIGSGGESIELFLIPAVGESAVFRGHFLPPKIGKYALKIKAKRANGDLSKLSTEIIVHQQTDEFKFLAAHWKFLKDIASSSGGKFYTSKEFKNHIKTLKPQSIKKTTTVSRLLIDYPYILIFLVFLIVSEWILRIREGLS